MVHPINAVPGWLAITIPAPTVMHETLNSFLFDFGCRGVISIKLPEISLKGYLPAPYDISAFQNQWKLFIENMQKIFPEARLVQWTLTKIETEDWAGNWKQFFKTDKITPKFKIVPVCEPIPPDRPEWVIKINSGPVFGIGSVFCSPA